MNTRKTYFISDLHLDQNHPKTINLFTRFLAQCDHTTDCIYILGDLFEVYIGDDDRNHLQTTVIKSLKEACARGINIYYMHGNRDFLISDYFLRESGCHLLAEESVINLYGQQVLLMHGDTLCSNDHAYMRARCILRNPFSKWFFLQLPLSLRMKIANRLREKSKQYTQTTTLATMDVVQETVEEKISAHQVNYLIHGHTHQPSLHQFMLQQPKQRWVLGAWHDHAIILVWDQNQHVELIDIMNIHS